MKKFFKQKKRLEKIFFQASLLFVDLILDFYDKKSNLQFKQLNYASCTIIFFLRPFDYAQGDSFIRQAQGDSFVWQTQGDELQKHQPFYADAVHNV